jgi:hypothetical protein
MKFCTLIQYKRTRSAIGPIIIFAKKIFSTNSPKDSQIILYMLPWLLSVNRPSVPGYIKDLKARFHVFGYILSGLYRLERNL